MRDAGAALAAPGRDRLQLRGPRSGRSRRTRSAGCCRRCATSVGWGRAPSTCATSRRVCSTPTSRRASTSGTTPPAPWSPRAQGHAVELIPGAGGQELLICAPGARVRRVPESRGRGRVSRPIRGNSAPTSRVLGTRRGNRCAPWHRDGAQSGAEPMELATTGAAAEGSGGLMATDYDAPRKTEEESEESIEELKARRHDKNSGKVDEDEAEAAESFELPGADLSHEELAVEVKPKQERRVHLHELLPGPPPLPARGREEADLQGLRLSSSARGTSALRGRRRGRATRRGRACSDASARRTPVRSGRSRRSAQVCGVGALSASWSSLTRSGGRCPVDLV